MSRPAASALPRVTAVVHRAAAWRYRPRSCAACPRRVRSLALVVWAARASHREAGAELVLAGCAAVLVEVVGDLVAGHAGAGCGRDGLQGPDGALEFLGGPGQGGVAPAGDVLGALRAGQVPDRGLLEERGGQRAGVAEPGGVHRCGDDRLTIWVTAVPRIAVEQVGDPGQVLGDLPVLPGIGCRRGRRREHRVAGAGRSFQVGGGEPVRDVDDPAAGRDRSGRGRCR